MDNIIINNSENNKRIDLYLIDKIDMSRSKIQDKLKKGEILVNEKQVKSSYILKENDVIGFNIEEEIDTDIEPENIPLDIVYEDNDVIVVNKKNGMVVHPAPGNNHGTLVNALLYHSKNLSKVNGEFRPGIVHRIDAYTTGLLMVAKNDGRDEKDRKKMAVTSLNSKKAITHFRVLERYKNASLIELQLETGRTHQIRVHMNYIGYPVVNDPVYGRRKLINNDGQCLHAKTLGFVHPTTGKYMEFTSELPDKFINILNIIKEG